MKTMNRRRVARLGPVAVLLVAGLSVVPVAIAQDATPMTGGAEGGGQPST